MSTPFRVLGCGVVILCLGLGLALWPGLAAEPEPTVRANQSIDGAKVVLATRDPEIPPGLIPMQPEGNVWVDKDRRRVVLLGEVCFREGQLEMFACPRGTKEHESVLSVACKAFVVHAALIAVGAQPGHPAQWSPVYVPATGPEIEVTLFWSNEHGERQRARAQDWIRHMRFQRSWEILPPLIWYGTSEHWARWLRSGKTMTESWVFAGSGFIKDPVSGDERYLAEEGYLICVSNFATAMLDLPVESSQDASGLLFEANTERIPPLGTKVSIVLTPKPTTESR